MRHFLPNGGKRSPLKGLGFLKTLPGTLLARTSGMRRVAALSIFLSLCLETTAFGVTPLCQLATARVLPPRTSDLKPNGWVFLNERASRTALLPTPQVPRIPEAYRDERRRIQFREIFDIEREIDEFLDTELSTLQRNSNSNELPNRLMPLLVRGYNIASQLTDSLLHPLGSLITLSRDLGLDEALWIRNGIQIGVAGRDRNKDGTPDDSLTVAIKRFGRLPLALEARLVTGELTTDLRLEVDAATESLFQTLNRESRTQPPSQSVALEQFYERIQDALKAQYAHSSSVSNELFELIKLNLRAQEQPTKENRGILIQELNRWRLRR